MPVLSQTSRPSFSHAPLAPWWTILRSLPRVTIQNRKYNRSRNGEVSMRMWFATINRTSQQNMTETMVTLFSPRQSIARSTTESKSRQKRDEYTMQRNLARAWCFAKRLWRPHGSNLAFVRYDMVFVLCWHCLFLYRSGQMEHETRAFILLLFLEWRANILFLSRDSGIPRHQSEKGLPSKLKKFTTNHLSCFWCGAANASTHIGNRNSCTCAWFMNWRQSQHKHVHPAAISEEKRSVTCLWQKLVQSIPCSCLPLVSTCL